MTIHRFTPRQDVRLSARRLARRPMAGVVRLKQSTERLYRLASSIDDAEPVRAQVMYEAILWGDPHHARSMVNLGVIFYRRDETEQARALFERAVEVDSKCSTAHYNLGCMMVGDGCFVHAISLISVTCELDPEFPDAWFNLGWAYREVGREERARECFATYRRLGGKEMSGSVSEEA